MARPMRSKAHAQQGHAQQGPGVGQILQPRDRGLRTQFAIGRLQIERHLEHGTAAQRTGVVSVFISAAIISKRKRRMSQGYV